MTGRITDYSYRNIVSTNNVPYSSGIRLHDEVGITMEEEKVKKKELSEEKFMILIDDECANFVKVLDSGKYKVPFRKESRFTTMDFINNLTVNESHLGSILPKNCRYSTKLSDGSAIYVIEEDPSIRTVSVNLSFQGDIERMKIEGSLEQYGLTNFLSKQPDPPYRFNLSFPYIIYIIHILSNKQYKSLELFYRLHPLSSLKDYLLIPNVPNISDAYKVCLGGNQIVAQPDQTVHDVINEAIGRFWFNDFNHDYSNLYKSYAGIREISNFLIWSYYTKEDPMFVFNVKWRGCENNLEKEIETIRMNYIGEDNYGRSLSVKKIYDLLRYKDRYENSEKSRSFSDSVMLDSDEVCFLTVGDSIEHDNKKMYVNAIEFKDSGSNYVELSDENNNTLSVRLTSDLKKSFHKQLYNNPDIKNISVGGREYKINDLIVIDIPEINQKSFKKISKIRKNVDGTIDILFGNSCYILNENTSNFFKHLDKIDFNGLTLKKDSCYFLITKDGTISTHRARFMKFKDLSIYDSGGSVDFAFETLNMKKGPSRSDNFRIKFQDSGRYQICESNEFKIKPPVFLISNKVYINSDQNFRDYYFHDNKIISLKKDEFLDSSKYPNFYDPKQAMEASLIKNKTELFIPGKYFDVHFKIGDKVVVACWNEPEEMLKVREITGFGVDDNLVLSIITTCDSGQLKAFPYIYFNLDRQESTGGVVLVGSIRHIIPEYLGIKSGQRVVAIETGIPSFPKKDVNTVIGFINDTVNKIPMMLCSNFCTFWATNEESLNSRFKFSNESKKSKIPVTNHVTNIGKIPHQMGDLFIHDNDIVMLKNNYPPSSSNMMKVSFGNGYYDQLGRYMSWNNKFRRYGFLTERFKKQDYADPEKFRVVPKAVPDLYGWYYSEDVSLNLFINRRMLDVSDISK